MSSKILLLSGVFILTACSSVSGPDMSYSGKRYVPRPNIPVSQYTQENFNEDRMDRRSYNEYEHREQCQKYRRIPRNSVMVSNCDVMRAPDVVVKENKVVTTQEREIFHSYTVLFDFDRSNVRDNEQATINQVADEISTYRPGLVTVTGFADRSGKPDYNQRLSARRAQSVSDALTARGIPNRIISEDARGEYDSAVPTADGVKLQENRRVVIDFHR
jgi:outer membrane protein OmpA-like peptidoglycan-associated protein